MDSPNIPEGRLDVDVDRGFAMFFFFLLCFFLLVALLRCAKMVVDPYSAITMRQAEQSGDWESLKVSYWVGYYIWTPWADSCQQCKHFICSYKLHI